MRVVVDNSVLMYLIHPKAPAPVDPNTGQAVEHCAERVEGLLQDLEKLGTEVIVPAPVLSELMIKAPGRENEIVAALTNQRAVRVVPFDTLAAIENAMLRRHKSARAGGTKKEVSFDLQILAIARVSGAEIILTDDENLRRRAIAAGIGVMGIAELHVPESLRQRALPFDPLRQTADGDLDRARIGADGAEERPLQKEPPRGGSLHGAMPPPD